MEADELTVLRCKLKKVEEERLKAAEYGLQLLESQSELQNRLDKCRIEMMTLTENYEQGKYTLQREVELKNRMLESLSSEYEAVKQQHRAHLEKLEERLGRSHGQEVNELKNKLEKLKAELDEARLSEKQLKHKIDHQKELLASKSEEIQKMSEHAHESMSAELLTLQVELTHTENQKSILKEELNDLQYRQAQLELLNQNLMRQVDRLKEEKEEREEEAVSYCNALEKAREMNQDLQVQLDQVLQQAADPSSRGHSLFAEVEDRRAAMERQLISMKVKYQSLKKQNAFNREQMQRMKLQIAALLQMKGSQTEHDQQERLFAMVEQKNSEIKHLLSEIESLQKFQSLYENMEAKPSSRAAVEDNTYYTDLLQMKLDNLNKEYESCKGEFSIQRMRALFESQRALDLERKLFANERSLQVAQSENMQLRARLDELKLKYEPEEKMLVPVLKKRREVLPLDGAPPKQASVESTVVQEGPRAPAEDEEEEAACPHPSGKSSLPPEAAVPLRVAGAVPSPRKDAPADTQLKKEKKCVRLVDAPPDAEGLAERSGNTPDPARSAAESKLQKEAQGRETAASSLAKGPRKSSHPIIYVSSKSTPETQCPQQ
ncbi:protein Spindly isoform X2 [Erinaceus europaeus]|uniref:Protein Spindly n=1 Tax=Erinaceus europaeus TaxID=9365 RepID=A0ABM3XWC5_ERIEU|nr:protein Spindly isoform X2 [Erinaceus europaeus]